MTLLRRKGESCPGKSVGRGVRAIAPTRLKPASHVQEYGRGKVAAFDRLDHRLPLQKAVMVPPSLKFERSGLGVFGLLHFHLENTALAAFQTSVGIPYVLLYKWSLRNRIPGSRPECLKCLAEYCLYLLGAMALFAGPDAHGQLQHVFRESIQRLSELISSCHSHMIYSEELFD
jgi:hypothetical protein